MMNSRSSFDDALLVEFDGDAREQTWSYIPPGEDHNDYYSALWPDLFINLLMESSEVVFTVPTEGRPYVITFPRSRTGPAHQRSRRPV